MFLVAFITFLLVAVVVALQVKGAVAYLRILALLSLPSSV